MKNKAETSKTKLYITKSDLVSKECGSFPYKMEGYLKKMGLVNIDNSDSIKETINKIISLIFERLIL